MAEKLISFHNMEEQAELFGGFDSNIKMIEEEYEVTVLSRNGQLKVTSQGEKLEAAVKVIEGLLDMVQKGQPLNEQNIRNVMQMVADGQEDQLDVLMADCICITSKGKPVKPKTLGQEKYVQAIRDNTIVFGIGPAGTGKTYLAVAMAVKAFKAKEVSRIVLTRPAVEAGESLGFLPGDLQQKVDPYLRPLYDALFDMLGPDQFQRQLERGTIEVAPLAYMRGRTLDDSFIILDEAQNTTSEQMKMFLTRLGMNSKAVVTGDITQIDLPGGKKSGLQEVTKILKGINGIATIRFDARDVVRHRLVQEIVNAYERYQKKKEKK
jgi:phosphate starvation-inducible protein PhoH and related proteins